MPTFDRRNRQDLDQLVEEYVTTSKINRRQFLGRAMAAGLSVSAATALLEACGGGSSTNGTTKVTSIDALTVWSGSELATYQNVNAAFKKKTGITVNVESTRDLPTVLTTRVRGNNAPDITGSPGLSQFRTLAAEGKILRLDKFFDMATFRQNYSKGWIDLATVNGGLYAVFPKANSKGTVWYNPKQFQANGYTVPTTFNDMVTLSNKIASSGKYPWSMGVESGAASGWPAADWVDQIYLALNGPDMSDKWVAHQIPWTDPSVKNSFQMFGEIVHGTHYINGGAQAILATAFQDACYLPYDTPPKAYMMFLGDFAAGFIKTQFPSIQSGTDFNFFSFPTINPQYAGAITGGADMMFAMQDNDGTRQYTEFVASAEAQQIWVQGGGASSVNKAVPLSIYPDDVARATAQQLNQATSFRTSQDDSMPTAMENAFWKGMLTYIQDASQLDSILSGLENTAMTAYAS
jgi:alpha-glucoside transport system substrate-binding protein